MKKTKKRKTIKIAPKGLTEVILGAGIIGAIYQLLRSTKSKVNFRSIGTRPVEDLKKCILKVGNVVKNCDKFFTDSEYQVFTVSDVQRFLAMDTTDKMEYEGEKFDCDNFAFLTYAMAEVAMPGCCFGVLFAGTPQGAHAVNCFIDENNRFYIIEPQTDEIRALNSDWFVYFILI